jgi:hypothetical protein
MSYYQEINRATRQADYIINEVLYILGEEIDLAKLEFIEQPNFNCNFMKVFHQRLKLHQANDNSILYDEAKGVIKYKK